MSDTLSNIPQKRRPFPTFADLVVLVLLFGVGQILGALIVMPFLMSQYGETGFGDSPTSQIIIYTASMATSLIAMSIYRRARGANYRTLRYRLKWFNGSLVIVGLVAITAIGIIEEPLFALMPEEWMDFVEQAIGTGKWAILNTVLIAPVLEEMIFRGVILESVRSRWGKIWAIVVSALLFGVVHGVPQQAINAAMVGVILGAIYIATDSLLAVIVLHAINNALSYVLMILFPNNNDTLRSMITSDVVYWSVYAASCVAVIICGTIIFTAVKRHRTKTVAEPATEGNNTANQGVNE